MKSAVAPLVDDGASCEERILKALGRLEPRAAREIAAAWGTGRLADAGDVLGSKFVRGLVKELRFDKKLTKADENHLAWRFGAYE